MKRYYIYLMMALIVTGTACQDDNEKMFGGDPSIHFALSQTQLDSIVVSFLSIPENQHVVQLPVELAGYAKTSDCTFRLAVDQENTTAIAGTHYQPLAKEYRLPKGEYAMNIPLTVFCTGEMDSVTFRLALKLEVPEGFTEGIPYRQRVLITVSNQVPPVVFWNYFYRSDFGSYSKVKHRYILSKFHLKYIPDEWSEIIAEDSNVWKAYGIQMNNFFKENVIYDENNQRIEPWLK